MNKITLEGVVGEVYDWLQDEIKATSYKGMTAQLDAAQGDIELHINSKGGDAFEGIAIMNALKNHDGQVNVIVDGFCASAATLPLFAADKVQAHKTSLFVFHKGATLAMGHANDIRRTADELDTLDDAIIELYMNKFNGSQEELVALMDEDKIITAQTALELGFVDELIADENDAKPKASLDATDKPAPKMSVDDALAERSEMIQNSFLHALRNVSM